MDSLDLRIQGRPASVGMEEGKNLRTLAWCRSVSWGSQMLRTTDAWIKTEKEIGRHRGKAVFMSEWPLSQPELCDILDPMRGHY
jgi:hypothetical protein